MLAFVVPSVLFGVFSGVIVDIWSKRLLLVYTNAARCILAILFLLSRDHVTGLILISIFFSTASQFFGTTDAVTVPFVVEKSDLIAANSMFSLAVTGSQLIGMIFLGPILLPTVGSVGVFVLAAVMFAGSVVCAWLLPPLEADARARREKATDDRRIADRRRRLHGDATHATEGRRGDARAGALRDG